MYKLPPKIEKGIGSISSSESLGIFVCFPSYYSSFEVSYTVIAGGGIFSKVSTTCLNIPCLMIFHRNRFFLLFAHFYYISIFWFCVLSMAFKSLLSLMLKHWATGLSNVTVINKKQNDCLNCVQWFWQGF